MSTELYEAIGSGDYYTPEVNEVTAMAVDHLQQICHKASADAGWWKPGDTENPLMFGNKLLLIHTEISEATEGDRKSCPDDKLPHRPMREVELADAVIRIFDLAGAYKLDLAGALVEKMAYNKTRADHKPEARAAAGGKKY
jgi:NTP pyrophosphatase (non-canonical NTP hydrolase)